MVADTCGYLEKSQRGGDMNWHKLTWWGVGILFLLLVMGVNQWPDGKVRVSGCDVGQGDATMVTQGFDQILIDGGPPNGRVLACLAQAMPFWDRQIELLIVSHPEADHIGGLTEVVRRYLVRTILVPNTAVDSELFKAFYQAVRQEGGQIITADQGQMIKVGELGIQVLLPDRQPGEALVWSFENDLAQVMGMVDKNRGGVNEQSAVVLINYKHFDALLTGDISSETEEKLVGNKGLHQMELVKVAHHGSKYSSAESLVKLTDPGVALIEVGEKNSYGHPTQEVIDRWVASGAKVFRTDKDGMVVISSTGENGVMRVEMRGK